MKPLLAFFSIFVLNAWYLISIRLLMTRLEQRAIHYWEKIGRPNSFSANHVASILSNLYRREMTHVCQTSSLVALLRIVRVLLPLAFGATGLLLLALGKLLNG